MKSIQRIIIIISLAIFSFFFGVGAFALTESGDMSPGLKIALKSDDIQRGIPINPPDSDPTEDEISPFAWQTFVALNWPANCDSGAPLGDKKIGEKPNAPRVWEFYNLPSDIFLPGGRNPGKVNPSVPPGCQTSNFFPTSIPLRLSETEGVSTESYLKTRAENSASILTDSGEPLIDQNGNYIINEMRINPAEVKQILNNRWYDPNELKRYQDDLTFALVCSEGDLYNGNYPCLNEGGDRDEKVGAIELKVAWMVLPNLESAPHYYTTTRTIAVEQADNATGKPESITVPVALVGFHIMQKTNKAGWILSTFEHADVLKHLYDPNCEIEKPSENCVQNTSHAKDPYLWRREFPHAVTERENGEIVEQIPSQISRVIEITEAAANENHKWQDKLRQIRDDSIWQNYQLIGTQWINSPQFPYKDSGVKPQQSNEYSELVNVTLEPYVHPEDRQKFFSKVSCAHCHIHATLPYGGKADFSFLFAAEREKITHLLQEKIDDVLKIK